MGSIFGIEPAVGNGRFEEVFDHSVGVGVLDQLRFDGNSTFELGKTFQFAAGKAAQKVHDVVTVARNSSAKKSTNKGRATSCNGQS